MTRIDVAPRVTEDLDRIRNHLIAHESGSAPARIEQIFQSLDVLQHSPQIGRPIAGGLRELVIGRGASGYVALYQYLTLLDVVVVLAIRSQREAGYAS